MQPERVAFPDLHLPALGMVPDQLDIEQQRSRWRSLAGAVAGVVAAPWLAWKLTDLGLLGPVDALFLVLVLESVAWLGVAWGLIAFRQEKHREALRVQRARQEAALFEQGYSTLYAAFDRASQAALSPDHVALLNFGQFDERLGAVAGRVDDLVAATMAALHREPAVPSVTVCPVPCPALSVQHNAGDLPESEPSILPLLDWPEPSYPALAECFVGRVVQGQGFGLRAFVEGGICSEVDYKALVADLLAAAILVRGPAGKPVVAPDLDAWRSAWKLSVDDFAQQMAFEDDVHSWAANRLALVPSPAA